jgi:hypothetical protein
MTVKSSVRLESRLVLISLSDAYIVISPSDVQFGENTGVSEFIDYFRDKGESHSVRNGSFIERTIVLDWSERTIFLLNKEER